MTPGNLMPTPIVDKNGVASIRHKRQETAGGSLSAALPVPSLQSASAAANPVRDRLLDSLSSVCDDPEFRDDFPDFDVLAERLERYPEATVKAFDELIVAKGSEGDHYERLLASCLQNDLDGDTASYIGRIVDMYEVQGEWSDAYSADYSYVDALRTYRGLQSVKDECGFSFSDNLYDSERNREVFDALVTVSNGIHNEVISNDRITSDVIEWVSGKNAGGIPVDYNQGWYLRSRYILSRVAEHPEDAQRILNLFYDRGEVSDGVLEQVLDSEAPAMSDGYL
jgi:hypothetical protein